MAVVGESTTNVSLSRKDYVHTFEVVRVLRMVKCKVVDDNQILRSYLCENVTLGISKNH